MLLCLPRLLMELLSLEFGGLPEARFKFADGQCLLAGAAGPDGVDQRQQSSYSALSF